MTYKSLISVQTILRGPVVTTNLTDENIDLFLKRLGSNLSILERKVDVDSPVSDDNPIDKPSD